MRRGCPEAAWPPHRPERAQPSDCCGGRAQSAAALRADLLGPRARQEELGTPALAFVRAVCEVMGLDAGVAAETAVLRRNLLRLVDTREFAPAAAFKVSRRRPGSGCCALASWPL